LVGEAEVAKSRNFKTLCKGAGEKASLTQKGFFERCPHQSREFFHGPFTPYVAAMNTVIRIIKHAECYEVRTSRFFYFDNNPGRRSINNRMSPKEAEEAARRSRASSAAAPNERGLPCNFADREERGL
jgi:hypothetical protein